MKYKILFTALLFNIIVTSLVAQDIEVDEMPYFAGCGQYKPNSKEKNNCSLSNLAYYLNKNLVFPSEAKQANISGIVYVLFTVRQNGTVDNVKVLNDIGGGCAEMAKKVVAEMPLWEAAKKGGKTIDYELRLPVHFKLDSENYASDFDIFWGDVRFDEISLPSLENYIRQPIIVRNEKGEVIDPITLTMTYEHEKSLKTIGSKGSMNKEMIKILRKARVGGKVTLVATLQKKGTFFELFRTFTIVD
jgi:TonB family protein